METTEPYVRTDEAARLRSELDAAKSLIADQAAGIRDMQDMARQRDAELRRLGAASTRYFIQKLQSEMGCWKFDLDRIRCELMPMRTGWLGVVMWLLGLRATIDTMLIWAAERKVPKQTEATPDPENERRMADLHYLGLKDVGWWR